MYSFSVPIHFDWNDYMTKTDGIRITVARLLALALPWLIMVFAVFPYGLREGCSALLRLRTSTPLCASFHLVEAAAGHRATIKERYFSRTLTLKNR